MIKYSIDIRQARRISRRVHFERARGRMRQREREREIQDERGYEKCASNRETHINTMMCFVLVDLSALFVHIYSYTQKHNTHTHVSTECK